MFRIKHAMINAFFFFFSKIFQNCLPTFTNFTTRFIKANLNSILPSVKLYILATKVSCKLYVNSNCYNFTDKKLVSYRF